MSSLSLSEPDCTCAVGEKLPANVLLPKVASKQATCPSHPFAAVFLSCCPRWSGRDERTTAVAIRISVRARAVWAMASIADNTYAVSMLGPSVLRKYFQCPLSTYLVSML